MKLLGAFVEASRRLSVEAFCQAYPHPVLLHSVLSGHLDPVEQRGDPTLHRLVIGPTETPDATLERVPTASGSASSERLPPGRMYTVYALAGDGVLSIGCGPACHVQIDDRSISRAHACFRLDGELCKLWDNDSSTGTQINDQLLEPLVPHTLRSGDRVTLGVVELQFFPPADFYAFARRVLR